MSLLKRLKDYVTPIDGNHKDLLQGNVELNAFRDFTSRIMVALFAIPLAMRFTTAPGLRPEQRTVGDAVAGLIGAWFGGPKDQVNSPATARHFVD